MRAATRTRIESLLRQRRLLVAATIGATVFVSVYAFAASLNVSSQTLGAGNSVVASCIPNPASVTVSYGTTYDPAVPGYRVSSVTITATTVPPGLTACAGKTITVDFTGAANASLGEVTTTIAASSPPPTLTIPVPATGASPAPGGAQFPVNAASVTGVSAVIAG